MDKQSKKYTLLIVEDDAPERKALVDKFTRDGFMVHESVNGEAGLATALREHPDIILLDIVMPKMDGMTMLKRLRETDEWGKHVPVIILTNLTSADEGRTRDITELEPAYYLVKTDWKIEDVVAKVRERLETPHS